MIKSVLIKDPMDGNLLIKVSYAKGVYEIERLKSLNHLVIEVRDERGRKVKMGEEYESDTE
ncbi:MAG: hypothetical protein HQK77_14220 [Desulfobacterales bacterium]|nr:hypothetical protein [Desulfobacterales bacterium]